MRPKNDFSPGEAGRVALIATIGTVLMMGLMALFLPRPAAGEELYPGPYRAEVIRIVDADTIEVKAHLWPGQTILVGVRLAGIDTPETFRPKCVAERAVGRKATAFVTTRVKPGDILALTDLEQDKYAGRVVGTLAREGPQGPVSLAAELVEAELAVPYDGGTKRDWCRFLQVPAASDPQGG